MRPISLNLWTILTITQLLLLANGQFLFKDLKFKGFNQEAMQERWKKWDVGKELGDLKQSLSKEFKVIQTVKDEYKKLNPAGFNLAGMRIFNPLIQPRAIQPAVAAAPEKPSEHIQEHGPPASTSNTPPNPAQLAAEPAKESHNWHEYITGLFTPVNLKEFLKGVNSKVDMFHSASDECSNLVVESLTSIKHLMGIEKNLAQEGSFVYAVKHLPEIREELGHITFDKQKWRDCVKEDDTAVKLGFVKFFYFFGEISKNPLNLIYMASVPMLPYYLMKKDFTSAGETLGSLLKNLSSLKVAVDDEQLMRLSMLSCFKEFFLDFFFHGKVSKVLTMGEGFTPKFDFYTGLIGVADVVGTSRQKCFEASNVALPFP